SRADSAGAGSLRATGALRDRVERRGRQHGADAHARSDPARDALLGAPAAVGDARVRAGLRDHPGRRAAAASPGFARRPARAAKARGARAQPGTAAVAPDDVVPALLRGDAAVGVAR